MKKVEAGLHSAMFHLFSNFYFLILTFYSYFQNNVHFCCVHLFLGLGEPNSHYKSDGYGVIKYGKHDDRTCTVIWFDNSGESLGVEEDVSVYDIAEHPDFVFNPGDLVVGISGSAHEVEDVTSKGGYCVAGQVKIHSAIPVNPPLTTLNPCSPYSPLNPCSPLFTPLLTSCLYSYYPW